MSSHSKARRPRPPLAQSAGRPASVAGVAATGAAGAHRRRRRRRPRSPNNVVVFPDRDFVTIEGYQSHIGETALVEVTRGSQVIGSAKGVVEEGDVAFEINHPGGYCWGAGTGLNVTPDIRPGDKVNISFNGIDAGDTIAQNAYVTGDATRQRQHADRQAATPAPASTRRRWSSASSTRTSSTPRSASVTSAPSPVR